MRPIMSNINVNLLSVRTIGNNVNYPYRFTCHGSEEITVEE